MRYSEKFLLKHWFSGTQIAHDQNPGNETSQRRKIELEVLNQKAESRSGQISQKKTLDQRR
jgi:hypothetical protein